MTLLAKSADAAARAEPLALHLLEVAKVAAQLYSQLPECIQREPFLLPDLVAAALLHDTGKSAVGFQQMLHGLRENWNGWRHEVLSASFATLLGVSEEVIFAILTHHRRIPGAGAANETGGRLRWHEGKPEDWRQITAEWCSNQETFIEEWRAVINQACREDLACEVSLSLPEIKLDTAWLNKIAKPQIPGISFARRRRASLLRGLLVTADHLASGHDSPPMPLDLTTFRPNFALRPFQERVKRKGHLILRAPTGSGKTEAALLWAAENQCRNGRFFYTLPYTAALNAMFERLGREFPDGSSSIGLLHGRAAHHLYESLQADYPCDPTQATKVALARSRLAHEMYYSARVCTPHQLLRFSMRGKGWEQILVELAGGCVVFDEVHSYDAALAGLILGSARLPQNPKTPFL